MAARIVRPSGSPHQQDSRKLSTVVVPEWRNGRRTGLKIPGPKGREGSNPSSGTTTYITEGTFVIGPAQPLRNLQTESKLRVRWGAEAAPEAPLADEVGGRASRS